MRKTFDSEKFIEYIRDKWKGKPCPMCGNSKWSVSEKIFELREFNYGEFRMDGVPIIPIVPITCENCGNIININALKTGIVDPPDKVE